MKNELEELRNEPMNLLPDPPVDPPDPDIPPQKPPFEPPHEDN